MRMYNLNCTAIIDYSHIHSIFLMSSITATIFYKFDTGMTTRSTQDFWAITLSKSAHWEKHYEFVKISLKIWCSQFVCLPFNWHALSLFMLAFKFYEIDPKCKTGLISVISLTTLSKFGINKNFFISHLWRIWIVKKIFKLIFWNVRVYKERIGLIFLLWNPNWTLGWIIKPHISVQLEEVFFVIDVKV